MDASRVNSRLKISAVASALTVTASAAFQPIWLNICQRSHFHFAATICTGGRRERSQSDADRYVHEHHPT